ncbi:MAG: Ribosomal silencing factor RsfS [Acidimicrobiales bacterium AG-410-I20]|nr:MAG: Ribosomal silencing factor RsfS [Acidimicrobiales bacterium AG-410-I20]
MVFLRNNLTTEEIKRWSIQAATAAEEKLGYNTVLLDVGALVGITDVFVITSGSNFRQVRAIVEEIEEQMLLLDGPKLQTIEGREYQEGPIWVLMDYGGFIVHVFDNETRELYDLERLWKDCPRIIWQENQ